MSRTINTSLATIQFQVNARQASAAMQALQDMANGLNSSIDKVKKNIENLGKDVPKDNPQLLNYQNQLDGLQKDLKDVQKAQRDFLKGAKAADQLWQAATNGNIESLSFRSIKAGINGLKKRQEGLSPGDAQDMKDWRIIKEVIDEADRVVKQAGADVQNVVQTIREGGNVSEQTMRQTINTLKELKGSVDETDADFRTYGNDLDFMEAKLQEFSDAQRRAKGEIVDANDARSEMNKLTEEGAAAAKREAEEADRLVASLKQESEELVRKRGEIKQNIEDTQKQIDENHKLIEEKHRQLAVDEETFNAEQEGRRTTIDGLKQQAEAERKLANEKSDAAETHRRAADLQKQTTEQLNEKVTELQGKLEALNEQKPAPNPVLEGVKQGAEEADKAVFELRQKLVEANKAYTDFHKAKRILSEFSSKEDADDYLSREHLRQEDYAKIKAEFGRKYAKYKDAKRLQAGLQADDELSAWNLHGIAKGKADIKDWIGPMREAARKEFYSYAQELGAGSTADDKELMSTLRQQLTNVKNLKAHYEELLKAGSTEYDNKGLKAVIKYLKELETEFTAATEKAAGMQEQIAKSERAKSYSWAEDYVKNNTEESLKAQVTSINEQIDAKQQSNQQSEEELRLKGELETAQGKLIESKKRENEEQQEYVKLQGEAIEQDNKAAAAETKLADAQSDATQKQADFNQKQQEGLDAINQMAEGNKALQESIDGLNGELEQNSKDFADNANKATEAEQKKQQARQLSIKRMEEMLAKLKEEYYTEELTAEKREEHIKQIQQLEKAISTEKAKPALQMMTERMDNLGALSASALEETKRFWEAMAQGADKGSEKLATAETHIKALVEEERKRSEEKASKVIGNMDNFSDKEISDAVRTFEQLRDAQTHGNEEWTKFNNLVQQGKQHLKELAKADALAKMEERMLNLTNLSDAALAETKKYWEALKAGAERGSEDLTKAETNLTRIIDLEKERTRIENERKAQIVSSGGSLNMYSEAEITEAIKAAKELHSHMASASPEAQKLADSIANAEAHIKQYGIEAARAAQRQDELDATMKKQFQTMINGMKSGVMPSQAAVKSQMNYWQKLIDDPKTAAESLQFYRNQLAEVKKMYDFMIKSQGESALKWFQQGSDKDASGNQTKEMADRLKEYRGTLLKETNADEIKQIDAILQRTGQTAKKAVEELMDFEKAKELALQAGDDVYGKNNPAFLASPEEIQAATKSIEKYREELFKTIKQKKDMGEATDDEEAELQELAKYLKNLKFEQDNFNMSREKMEALMANPVNATSLDELRAAIKRADGELKRMEGSLGQNNAQYKAFAEQVRNAKNQLKEMEGQAKASATAWEKAWSRLKTYVVMYMGFNAVWQKITGTAGDILELSDKLGEVRKTTGFTADEVGRLSNNLSKIDTRTPINELLSLSVAAGQLGLKTQEDVQGFTEAANKLMVALPEMGKEAATEMMKVALATGEVKRIQEQMDEGLVEGSSATAVAIEKIGSTIDRLRASSAAAAPHITDFVKRVGAVGAQSGITIDQVAALGSTVDALGMRVEMSATALSRMIPAIKRNAFEVAKAIGMAPNALRQMFDEAGGGMNAMLAIFQHIKDSGMNANDIEQMLGMGGMTDIMKDLNQQGARAGIVFAGLSQNVDVLREHLGIAKTAYEENTAIQAEYDRMNETSAAKWERLKNTIEEMFVGDRSQKFFGFIIDGLRYIVDLINGPLQGAFQATVGSLILIKSGFTGIFGEFGKAWNYLKDSAAAANKALQEAANATNKISEATSGVEEAADVVGDIGDALEGAQEAGEQAGEAVGAATGAIEGMSGAAKVSIFSINGLKTAWKGLDATMKANIIVMVIALIYTLGKAIYDMVTETTKANKALGEANAMIAIAIDRFEGYWAKLKETKTALDEAKKSTNGLTEGSEELAKATTEVVKADEAHKTAIAEINGIYGKYLGFILTEANYANLSAAAHDKVTAAIRREMLAKQQQAAIDNVTQENMEDMKDGLAELSEELREDGRLNNTEAGQAKAALQKYLRENFKFDTNENEFTVAEEAYKYLQSKGGNINKLKELDANQIAAAWYYEYLKDTFHLNKETLADITGVFPQGGSYRNTNVGGRHVRGGYASAYLDNMQDVAETTAAFAGEATAAQEDDVKSTTDLMKGFKKQMKDAEKKIKDKSLSEKERNAAYEDLANTLEGLDTNISLLDPIKDKAMIESIKKQADELSKSVDADKLTRARANAKSIFQRVIGDTNGEFPIEPLDPEKNPWGEKLGADSTDWKNMTAEQLVNRRKQMKDFVNAIQTDSDVKTVLAEDAALKKAIENGMASDMRTVIEWYNTERLKIQDELHARHLTNTGDWMDPKKTKARKKLLHDETKMFLDELDAYYTERKAKIQEAGIEEGITEAEMKNRTLANEAEWRQRRMELQKMYGDKQEEVTQKEQDAIFNIIAERTEDDVKVVEGMFQKTLDFVEKVSKMGEQGEKEAREFRAKMDKQAMQDLLKEQNAMHQQMKAIQDIIDKERPFNGITKNLRENLVTMGILTADMTEERNRLMAEGADMADFNARQAAEELKRTAFMLGEAENAYTTTIEDIMKRMADAGMQAWADELKANPQMREALIAQLHQTYDDIQEAIKKEASLMKKQAENMWNSILLPGGDGKTTIKEAFEKAIAQLGIDQGRVSRANSLIGAGQASERVADKLAIKQMQLQLTMQQHYYNLMRKQGMQRIQDLERQIELAKQEYDIEKAKRLEQDKQHAEMSLRLAMTKEQTELLKQQEDIIARTEESQNRLYKELREWGDLLASSMREVMEASNAGNAEYYNELAKYNLTGKGGPGAGTYIVIENEGKEDAEAHYEYLSEREALDRQHEIEQENAQAEAWKKVWDDLNAKMNEQITDMMNAALQNQSIDANTSAVNLNNIALNTNTQAMAGLTGQLAQGITIRKDTGDTTNDNGLNGLTDNSQQSVMFNEGVTPGVTWTLTDDQLAAEQAQLEKRVNMQLEGAEKVRQANEAAFHKVMKTEGDSDKQMVKSTQSTFAKMTAAANLYGIAYQTMSNDNLSASQKWEMFALQAAGNAAISMLTTDLLKAKGDNMVRMPGILGKLLGEMPYPAAMATYAVVTALLGGLMGMAVSKVAKSKSQIAQVTGASASAGKLATGMLAYAEGNVNEFTDPGSLKEGQRYNVDAADGRTYRARYMGKGAKTHITNGPEFHLVGEKGREAIIDAGTTRQITLNEPEIWHNIQTLYNGGSLRHSTRRRGVRAFADGNLDEFEMADGRSMMADSGFTPEMAMQMQAALDRNSAVMETIVQKGIKAYFDVYGKGGLVDSYDTGKKTVNRHGERY